VLVLAVLDRLCGVDEGGRKDRKLVVSGNLVRWIQVIVIYC
jgi:hypothetical protein